MKSPSPHAPRHRSHCRWASCIAAAAMFALAAPAAAQITSTINFDTAGNWIPDGTTSITSYANHGYAEADWSFAGNIVLRNGTAAQDGIAGALGTYSFRLRDATGSQLEATYNESMTVNNFGFDVRRWDGSPDPSFTVEYSTDSGTTYLPTDITINNAFLGDTSAWKTLTYSLSSPVAVTAGQFKVRVTRLAGERLMIDNFQWTTDPSGDTNPPLVITYAPENSALDVPVITTELVATFDEPIVKGSGNITLKLAADDSTAAAFNVADAAVAVSGPTATITLPASLSPSTAYYVNIAAGAFKDLADNNFVGISGNNTWAFTTGTPDVTPPALVELSPADDSSNVFPLSNLVITYGEAILAGSGSVVVKKTSDGSLVETITVPGAQVSVSGNSATIDPATVLDYATGYYVEVSAGAFTDLSSNDAPAISGAAAWNFSTRGAPAVVISQYYEGTGLNRYIELQNLTGSPVSLDGYRLTAWSTTDSAGPEGWKSGTNSTPRITQLSGYTIPANGNFLIAEVGVTAPAYAVANNDLPDSGGGTAINGDDSVVLYFSGVDEVLAVPNELTFTQDEVVDAISLVANDGADKSFYRLNDGPGFDFNNGSSILGYSSVWGIKTIAEVDGALETDDWYLSASAPIKTLTLTISPNSVIESDGQAATTGTVTRSGDTSGPLGVFIDSNNPSVALDEFGFVEIPAGQESVNFLIDVTDNPWIDGDKLVTFTVSAENFLPASDTLTVQDDSTDLPYPVVINEVDADTPGTDVDEFVELYNNSNENVSLDRLVMVLFNGNGNFSYRTVDLSGYSIPANGFFVIGSSTVPNVNLPDFTSNSLQNGEDAVALYFASPASIPNNTPVTSVPGVLVDAVVYGTNDPDASGLLAALTPGKPQVDEGTNDTAQLNSISRVPDGGAAFDSTLYVAQTPTPGATNVLPPSGNTFADWIAGFEVGGLSGFNDDFDNDGLANALENILGSDPSVANQGLAAVSASAGSLVFRHTLAAEADLAEDLTFEYEWSVDLANWQASGASAGGTNVTFAAPVVITPGAAGAPDLVEVTATVTGTHASKVFARLRVGQVVVAVQ